MGLFGSKNKEAQAGTGVESEPGAPAEAPVPQTTSARRQPLGRGEGKRSEGSGFGNESTGGDRPTRKGEAVATIGKSIIFKGELTGDEDLEIDGNVEGDIKLPNHELTVGAHGKVKAEITAKCVQVVGHVSGNIVATERVEIQASGVVEGDIRAPRLLVQEGAVVNGAIEMSGRKESPTATASSSGGTGPTVPGVQPTRRAG